MPSQIYRLNVRVQDKIYWSVRKSSPDYPGAGENETEYGTEDLPKQPRLANVEDTLDLMVTLQHLLAEALGQDNSAVTKLRAVLAAAPTEFASRLEDIMADLKAQPERIDKALNTL